MPKENPLNEEQSKRLTLLLNPYYRALPHVRHKSHPPSQKPTATTNQNQNYVASPSTFSILLFGRPYTFHIHLSSSPIWTDPFPQDPSFIIITYDVTNRASLHNAAHYWRKQVSLHYHEIEDRLPVMLLGLKRDLRTDERVGVEGSVVSGNTRIENGGGVRGKEDPEVKKAAAATSVTVSAIDSADAASIGGGASEIQTQNPSSYSPMSYLSSFFNTPTTPSNLTTTTSNNNGENTTSNTTNNPLGPTARSSYIVPPNSQYLHVMPQEAVRIASEMLADRYAECSAVTGELMWEVLEDVTRTAAKTTTENGAVSRGSSCVLM